MNIAVDFDGTIVEDRFPAIGPELPFAVETLRMLQKDQHRIILWTVREGDTLREAVEWCRKRGLEFYAVNKDFPEENIELNEQFSRKLKADVFIDDRQVGGLLDWGQIYRMITENLTVRSFVRDELRRTLADHQPPKKKHWWNKLF